MKDDDLAYIWPYRKRPSQDVICYRSSFRCIFCSLSYLWKLDLNLAGLSLAWYFQQTNLCMMLQYSVIKHYIPFVLYFIHQFMRQVCSQSLTIWWSWYLGRWDSRVSGHGTGISTAHQLRETITYLGKILIRKHMFFHWGVCYHFSHCLQILKMLQIRLNPKNNANGSYVPSTCVVRSNESLY